MQIKKRGTDIKLDVAKVLIFFFDALYTLIIVSGQYETNGNFAKRIRFWIFVGFFVAYIANAVLLTIIFWSLTVLVKKRTRLAIQMACCKGCLCKKYLCHTTCCAFLKKVIVLLSELFVLAGVASYFVGDNLNDAVTIEPDDPTTLSRVLSASLIIGGLLLIYIFSYSHTRVKEFDKKRENTRDDLIERGQIAEYQTSEYKKSKRNAEIFKKTYEFILHIFGLIPVIDGLFTSILEIEDPCEHKSFFIALWVIYGFILLMLAIYIIVYAIQLVRDITQQEIQVSTVKDGSKIDGKVTNIGGTVTCTYKPGTENPNGNAITIPQCDIKIEGGTTLSNSDTTIFGTTITITGGKTITIVRGKQPDNERGGTTIIEKGHITTKGGELIFNNGTVNNDDSTVFNIGGKRTPNGQQNEKQVLKIKGGITIIKGGTTTFTADSATITGGEATAINDKKQEDNQQQKRISVSRYNGIRMEKLKYLVPIVAIVSIFNLGCVGLFLIADNNQPLDCSPAAAGSKANYQIRIWFIAVALLLYILSMTLVSILRGIFQFWEEDEPRPKRPQRHPVGSQQHPVGSQLPGEEIELSQLT